MRKKVQANKSLKITTFTHKIKVSHKEKTKIKNKLLKFKIMPHKLTHLIHHSLYQPARLVFASLIAFHLQQFLCKASSAAK